MSRTWVFSLLYSSLILPWYLVSRLRMPEIGFLYIPILVFWTINLYDSFYKGEPDDTPVRRP